MAFKQFCSPHVHVSSLDSASTPAAFVRRELELGSKTLTTTDHGSLVACRQVYKLAKKAGLIPVVGVEGYFQDYSCERAQRSKYYHVTIHCPTQHCFEVVTKRISRADVERGQQAGSERKPIFTWEDLEEIAAAGATFGSGCLVGMVQRHLADSDDPEMAQKYFERLMNMAPGRFFVEVFPHRTDRNWMSGVRVTKEDGGKVDYRSKKKLRLDGGEIHVDDLPKLFSKNPQQYGRIRAVMENRKWVELAEPIVVRDAAAVDDYVKNDCSPWAPDGDSQEGANRFVLEMAAKYRIPVMISDDCHFTHPEDKVVQDVRLGAGSNGAWRMYSSYHRMSSDEAFAHFQASLGTTVKECEGWIDNSLAWAEMFRGFTLKSQPQLPTNFYPGDPIERLFDLIAAEGRFNPNDPRQVERLTKELGILHSNGRIDLIPYFFVTQEVVKLYESYGKLTGPGRGSAAGLLTAYLLGITHVDPIRFKLSTERFITKERILSGKMPDIDQDLPDRDLLEGVGDEPGWLHQRFGRHVAQIGALTSMKLRSSIKDVCRVMFPGGVPAEVEELTSRMLKPPQGVDDSKFVFGYVDDEEVKHEGSITYDAALMEFTQKYPGPWAVAQKCLGLTRQRTRHPCGFAIAGREIDDLVPLTVVGKEKSVTTSFPADGCEDAGIIKYDFLTVNSVRDIDQCLKLIRERTPGWESLPGLRGVRSVPWRGQLHDVWDLPNDQAVLRELAAGHTETVFQLCTPSAKKWLKAFNHNKPDGTPVLGSVEALAAFVALDRPGPLNAELMSPDGGTHNMMVEYCRRARGQQGSPDINDKFEKLFPETYGIPIYQEMIEKLTQEMAGITPSEAVELRGLLAKKKKDEVEKWRPRFVQGATKVLGSEEEASKLWILVYNYAQYSFNLSHSVCYAVIAYACGFLKHHFPLEWWCSVLKNASKDEVEETFWQHCGKLVDPPHVNLSGANYEIRDGRIRAPISLINGVGEKAQKQLEEGRPYADIRDFVTKQRDWQRRNATKANVAPSTAKKPTKSKKSANPEGLKLATSALHRGVVGKLISSGVMDTLFPPGMTLLDQLDSYEQILAEVTGCKREPMDPTYGKLTEIQRYQLRKSVLPAYSDCLTRMVHAPDLERSHLSISHTDRRSYLVDGDERLVIPTYDETQFMNFHEPLSTELAVGVVAYVTTARPFTWDGKVAVEYVLELDGGRFRAVWWPRKNRKPKDFGTGAVVAGRMSRSRSGSTFSIDYLVSVSPPL